MSGQAPFPIILGVLFLLVFMYIGSKLISGSSEGIAKGSEKSEKLTGQEAIIAKGVASFGCSANTGATAVKMSAVLNIRYNREGKFTIKPIAEILVKGTPAAVVARSDPPLNYDSEALKEQEKSSLENVRIEADFVLSSPYEAIRSGRITFWRDNACVNIYIGENPSAIDTNKLIDRCPESYLGSFAFTDNLGCGKILVVKTDPTDRTEVWIYALTSNLLYDAGEVEFALDNYARAGAGKECIVAAVNEGGRDDLGSVWYVQPGGIIKKTGNMRSGLSGKIGAFNCVKCPSGTGDFCIKGNAATCSNPYAGPDPTSSGEKSVGDDPYRTNVDDNCNNNSCDLLDDQDGACDGASGDKHCWTPKYELLCNDEGVWEACYRNGANVAAGGKNYRCNEKKEWVES